MEKVRRTGFSREAYIRAVLSDTVPVELPELAYADFARELNRVGANINQIAAVANSRGFVNAKEYEQNYNTVMNICSYLIEFLVPHKKSTYRAAAHGALSD